MNIESFRSFCLLKKGVTEEFPFDENTLVFKVMGKMFALTNLDSFESINLKCDPEDGVQLREQYSSVLPGYHMNKQHWNSVYAGQDVPDQLFYELALHSYELIKASLPAAIRKTL